MSFADTMYFIIPLVIASTIPLALVALGALFSERSGVINIALEGIMLMGAFVGAIVIQNLENKDIERLSNLYSEEFVVYTEDYLLTEFGIEYNLDEEYSKIAASGMTISQLDQLISSLEEEFDGDITDFEYDPLIDYEEGVIAKNSRFKKLSDDIFEERNQLIVLAGLLTGAIVGIVFSLLHAFASINMKANQIISATALNMFAPAFAIFTARTIFGTKQVAYSRSYRIPEVPYLSEIPVIGDIFFKGAYLSTLLGIIIFIVAILVLYKTKQGLRLRSCGENPHAADSLGINIYKVRYAGVMVSGALAGMGGVIFILSFTVGFDASVAGFGFLSLSVLIFGNWKPKLILLAALFFGTMRIVGSTVAVIPFLEDLALDPEIYSMIPYAATLVALAFVSKNSAAPIAAGEPYDPGKR